MAFHDSSSDSMKVIMEIEELGIIVLCLIFDICLYFLDFDGATEHTVNIARLGHRCAVGPVLIFQIEERLSSFLLFIKTKDIFCDVTQPIPLQAF